VKEKNIWKNEKKHNHGEKIILGMDPLRCDHNIIVWEVMPPTKVTYESNSSGETKFEPLYCF
jgi:hypothetical protein